MVEPKEYLWGRKKGKKKFPRRDVKRHKKQMKCKRIITIVTIPQKLNKPHVKSGLSVLALYLHQILWCDIADNNLQRASVWVSVQHDQVRPEDCALRDACDRRHVSLLALILHNLALVWRKPRIQFRVVPKLHRSPAITYRASLCQHAECLSIFLKDLVYMIAWLRLW